MKEQQHSPPKKEAENQQGKQGKGNSTLEQQQTQINQPNVFEFIQMNKQIQEMQKNQTPTYYYDPYTQTYQPVQSLNNQAFEMQESFNQFDGNCQEYKRERGGYRGYRGNHHHHNHNHYGRRHHRDFNRDQFKPENQQVFSDEYWHQIHDRRQYFHPHPHHPFHQFNPWNERHNHQMYFHPPPPPPAFFNGQVHQQQHPCYLNLHPFHQQPYNYTNQENSQAFIKPQQNSINQKFAQNNDNKCKKRWKEKHSGKQGCWKKRRGRSHSRSSSSSSEASRQQYTNEKTKLYIEQITNYYTFHLQNFFQQKSIKPQQRKKISKLLIDKYPKYQAPFQKIFESFEYLQTQNLLYHMPYIKVAKILIKLKFNMEDVVPKISCIQAKKIKKFESDQKYKQFFGNQQIQPPLQHSQLIDMNQANTIYLIDGNNVLPTHKHFRNYFQSTEKYKKLQAQLRFQWLVSFGLEPQNVYLFFDQKYPEEDIKLVSSILFPNNKQRDRANKIRVFYGEQTIADDKIVQKLTQIKDTQKQIILVSADRELYIRCSKIAQIRHTGGRFFFKFLKYIGVHRNQNEKFIKKLIKSVIRNNN